MKKLYAFVQPVTFVQLAAQSMLIILQTYMIFIVKTQTPSSRNDQHYGTSEFDFTESLQRSVADIGAERKTLRHCRAQHCTLVGHVLFVRRHKRSGEYDTTTRTPSGRKVRRPFSLKHVHEHIHHRRVECECCEKTKKFKMLIELDERKSI